jgi:hypothetical protein
MYACPSIGQLQSLDASMSRGWNVAVLIDPGPRITDPAGITS